MRAVIQRVREAQVSVEGEIVGQIRHGLLVLLGVTTGDTEVEADFLSEKIIGLRIFSDRAGKFAHSVQDVGGSLLVVSQFTLYGATRKAVAHRLRPRQSRPLPNPCMNILSLAASVAISRLPRGTSRRIWQSNS